MNIINYLLIDGHEYLLLFFFLIMNTIIESSKGLKKYKYILFYFSSIILACFIGFRWETGTDWEPYKELFDSIQLNWTFLFNVYHFDIGYVFFNALIRIFTDSYTIFLIFNSGITIFLLAKIILKISPYPNLSLLFFYTNYMIAQFMGSNRRMMAMVFCLWLFYYVYQNNKKSSYISLGSAFLFHRSSIIGILTYLIPHKIISIKKTLLLLTISLLIGILQLPAKCVEITGSILSTFMNNPLIEKMVFYSENNEEHLIYGTGNLIISTILAVAKRSILLIFYFYIIKKNKIDDTTSYLYNIYIIGFIGYLSFIGSFFQMLSAYFTFVEILLIGKIYSYTTGKIKIVFCFLLCFYGLFQMMNALNVYPELYMPYLPFWTTTSR